MYYIKYFFYIALNWNLRLAFFSIYNEIKGEHKYRINTVRLNDLQKLVVTGDNRHHAEMYQGAGYYLLENVFTHLQKLHAPDGFVDLGSGKGRVLVVAAHYGFNKIKGVDFAMELCQEAENNCRRITQGFPWVNWKVLCVNAASYQFEKDDHVFFFFNPFKETVMNQVISNIILSQKNHPRKIFVVYINPQLKKLFINAGFKEVYNIKRMQFVEACIYEKNL
ncbi:MAG: class I SAM-dependent methyltransferase [Chitinophagaceae bacterium]